MTYAAAQRPDGTEHLKQSDVRILRLAAARLQSALEGNKIEHDVKEYPDAGHSFLDEHKGLIGVLGVVIGASYKDKDAADARNRIRAFFARHIASAYGPKGNQ